MRVICALLLMAAATEAAGAGVMSIVSQNFFAYAAVVDQADEQTLHVPGIVSAHLDYLPPAGGSGFSNAEQESQIIGDGRTGLRFAFDGDVYAEARLVPGERYWGAAGISNRIVFDVAAPSSYWFYFDTFSGGFSSSGSGDAFGFVHVSLHGPNGGEFRVDVLGPAWLQGHGRLDPGRYSLEVHASANLDLSGDAIGFGAIRYHSSFTIAPEPTAVGMFLLLITQLRRCRCAA